MAFLSEIELKNIPFKKIGKEVKISRDARIYNPEETEIGDYSRIDDFCVISGKIVIGKYVHIACSSIISGGSEGVFMDDFSGLAYSACIFARSDDYSGESLTNPTIPKCYQNITDNFVRVCKHVILGSNSVVFPGVTLSEGCAIGAMSTVNKTTEPWKIYVGSPARAIKERSKKLLELEKEFLKEEDNERN